MIDINKLVDIENGTQSRRIFWDSAVYEQERERIFSRAWLFLTHDSLLPKSGDFVLAKMAEDEVVVARQPDGSIRAFFNQCRHRGNRLCMAEAGNKKSLTCGYHGWTYDLAGELRAIPMEEAYGENFDRSNWRLREVEQLQVYNGFVFACMDPKAPSLREFLGDMIWYLDIWSDIEGGIEFLGAPSRSIIETNWKVTAENFVGDTYHLGATHGSALAVMAAGQINPQSLMDPAAGFQAGARYGHGLGVLRNGGAIVAFDDPEMAGWLMGRRAEVAAKFGEEKAALFSGFWNGALFPNCSFLHGINVFKVWNPIGPNKVEILTWAYAEKNMPEHLKERMKAAVHRTFGTAGILEADDLDNMEYSSRPNAGHITRQGLVNSQLGMGHSRTDTELPGVVAPYISEMGYRGYYRTYAQCMQSEDWSEFEKATADWNEKLNIR